MTVRWLSLVLVVCVACNEEEATAPDAKPGAAANVDADLTAATWAGKVHSSAGELKFKQANGALTATMAYRLFGRVILTDEFTVTRDADGSVHLKGSPKNRFVGGGRFPLAELVGKLSEDKSTIAGSHTIPQGEIKWFATTKQTVDALDPPLDVTAAEKALCEAPWEGTVGNKPATLVVAKKGGKLTGTLSSGKDKTALDVALDDKGAVRLSAVPKPTPQGLLTRTFAGYFGTAELKRFAGSEESVVKQGFVEQSNSAAFVFERQAPAQPKGKAKKKG